MGDRGERGECGGDRGAWSGGTAAAAAAEAWLRSSLPATEEAEDSTASEPTALDLRKWNENDATLREDSMRSLEPGDCIVDRILGDARIHPFSELLLGPVSLPEIAAAALVVEVVVVTVIELVDV